MYFVWKGMLSKMSFNYTIYGLNVESDLEIPEAYKQTDRCQNDVCVVIGDIPQDIQKIITDGNIEGNFMYKGSDFFIFRVADVADYLVYPSKIYIRLFDNANENDVKVFLLGTGFGLCMILRNNIAIHGGAVCRNNTGIIVTGESGCGKSTITNNLLMNGWKFIADDVCSITIKENGAHINMAYPQLKLCRDAAINMGYDLESLIYIDEDRDKFAVRLKEGYLPEGADFSKLFEITLTEADSVSYAKLEGLQKLQILTRNIFRKEVTFDKWKMPPEYLKQCLNLIQHIEVYSIKRPKDKDTVEDILNIISSECKCNI